jgi:hypothetical protein
MSTQKSEFSESSSIVNSEIGVSENTFRAPEDISFNLKSIENLNQIDPSFAQMLIKEYLAETNHRREVAQKRHALQILIDQEEIRISEKIEERRLNYNIISRMATLLLAVGIICAIFYLGVYEKISIWLAAALASLLGLNPLIRLAASIFTNLFTNIPKEKSQVQTKG